MHPRCEMTNDCEAPVTHLDEKGFIYCKEHGHDRRESGIYCRALRPWELRLIKDGKVIPSYRPISKREALARV